MKVNSQDCLAWNTVSGCDYQVTFIPRTQSVGYLIASKKQFKG